MKLLQLQQGSDEWLAHRAACLNASDAPAMMSVSPYKTRSELIRERATGIVKEYDAATLARFSAGHESEAAMRPVAELILGEELFPVVGEEEFFPGLRSSASSDGLTMDGSIGFEHKLWNETLAASVRDGIIPDSHIWQVIHQHAVFGLEKTLFMVSDGTENKMVWCWVEVSQEQIDRLLSGWRQFSMDVAAYQPEHIATKATGRAPETLPALHVEVTGMVTSSNLAAFKETALAVFRGIRTELVTDADFADAEKTVKWCKDVEDRLEQTKQHALSQTASIEELFRTMDAISEEARAVRLKLDKLVKGEKENRKVEIVMQAQKAIADHVDALNLRIGGRWLSLPDMQQFATAIKGLKTLDSMRDKIGASLANTKIEASAMADRIQANKESCADCMHLFPDFAQVCISPDFRHIVASRKAEVERREATRLEAERASIRSEEQAKAEREVRAKYQAEQDDSRDSETARSRAMEHERFAAAQKEAVCISLAVASVTDTGATMMLGEICDRLGFTITTKFLSGIGFDPVALDKNSKLYRVCDFGRICTALVGHIERVAMQ